MDAAAPSVLLLGFGNPGRGDDGLGPALAAAIERLELPGVKVEADYQLTVEDCWEAARHDVVLFADAAATGPSPFWLQPVSAGEPGFSSHGVEPSEVLGMSARLFGRRPAAYLLGIRGYEFERLHEGLSQGAAANLDAAVGFVTEVLRSRDFERNLSVDESRTPFCED